MLKEGYLAQNSLELKIPPGTPDHSMQNKELSHPKKIKVVYTQLPAGPASGLSPEVLAPAL